MCCTCISNNFPIPASPRNTQTCINHRNKAFNSKLEYMIIMRKMCVKHTLFE